MCAKDESDDSMSSADTSSPGPVLPVADRHAARRPGPHGVVQLGLRAPHRRHLRLPHRGHRRRSATARSATRRSSTRCAGSGLDWDEGPEVGGPHAPYRQSRARRDLPRRHRPPAGCRRGLRGYLAPPRRSRPVTWPRAAIPSWATTTSTASSPTSSARRSAPRAASRCCGCGCPTPT